MHGEWQSGERRYLSEGIYDPTQTNQRHWRHRRDRQRRVDTEDQPQSPPLRGALPRLSPEEIDLRGVGSGDIDARDVKAQEAAQGCAEYERPQEYRQYR
jgi:hypothetical protein